MNIEKTITPFTEDKAYKTAKNTDMPFQMPYFNQIIRINQSLKRETPIVFKRKNPNNTKNPNPFLPETFESNGFEKYFKTRRSKSVKPLKQVSLIENDSKLYAKYLQLLDEINHLKSVNEKLTTSAYRSYEDLKEEMGYEISRATGFKDSLLILLELKENKKLDYLDLRDRVTEPGNLFIRLSDLTAVHFIEVEEKSGFFSITPGAIEFLEKRGL